MGTKRDQHAKWPHESLPQREKEKVEFQIRKEVNDVEGRKDKIHPTEKRSKRK